MYTICCGGANPLYENSYSCYDKHETLSLETALTVYLHVTPLATTVAACTTTMPPQLSLIVRFTPIKR